MKTTVKMTLLVLLSTAMGFAETPAPSPFGAWTIYHAQGDRVFMLQTVASMPSGSQAKLDVICRHGKLAALALEPGAVVEKTAESFVGVVPTTRLAFSMDDYSNSENWAVADDGHTLSPYSELFQAKLNRFWISRLTRTTRIAVQLDQTTGEWAAQPSFETGQLSAALSSVGCSY